MKRIKDYITEKLKIDNSTQSITYNYHPKKKDELKHLIVKLIVERGEDANLNDIDVSKIDNMSHLFDHSSFNGDISQWDVSNVTNMSGMFSCSNFNRDISKWDVSNPKNMTWMFNKCPLQNNPPAWYEKTK